MLTRFPRAPLGACLLLLALAAAGPAAAQSAGEALDRRLELLQLEIDQLRSAGQGLQWQIDALTQELDGHEARISVIEGGVKPAPDPLPDPIPDPDPEPEPDPDDAIKVSQLTIAAVTAALGKLKRDRQVIQLPAGPGWGPTKLKVEGKFCPHIRGADFMEGPAAYRRAIDDLRLKKAEAVAALRASKAPQAEVTAAYRAFVDGAAAFQPTTRNVAFAFNCDGGAVSRIDLAGLDLNGVDIPVYFYKLRGVARHTKSCIGAALFAHGVQIEAGIQAWCLNTRYSNSVADWNRIPVAWGSPDMLVVQDVIALPDTDADGATGSRQIIDITKHGGRMLLRRSVAGCSAGSAAPFRVHGGYIYTGKSGSANQGAARQVDVRDFLGVCDDDSGWTMIEHYGGAGRYVNVRNWQKSEQTLRAGYEPVIRQSSSKENPTCGELDPARYPYPWQTAGAPHDTPLYFENVQHHGRVITSIDDPGFGKNCAVDVILRAGRDIYPQQAPGPVLGTHPLEARMQ